MVVKLNTNEEAVTYKIVVNTQRPQKIVIRVKDAFIPNTYYENRWATVYGQDVFYVKMPTSPRIAFLEIFNSANGHKNNDQSFKFSVERSKFKSNQFCSATNNYKVQMFIGFIQEFAMKSKILSTKKPNSDFSTYTSNDGKFIIHYYDVMKDERRRVIKNGQEIPNPNYGRVVTTPMRTNGEKGSPEYGEIDISKVYTRDYTVPEIVAVGLHEYCHVNVNRNPADETEADLNALLIFLSLGYSKIAAYKAFINVFKRADSPQNRDRDLKIKNFIENFDKINMRLIA